MGRDELILEIAAFIASTHSTVRTAAEQFGLGKSTVHNYMTKHLFYLDKFLFVQVKEILRFNFKEKHLRGGEATKRRFKNLEKLIQ